MPQIPLNLFIDKDVYSKRNGVIGYGGDFKKTNYTFRSGQWIGKVFSFVQDHSTGKYYLMFYIGADEAIYKPTLVEIKSNDIDVVGMTAAIKEWEQQEKKKDEQQQIADNGLIRYYIEKYLPIVLLVAGAGYVLPKILKRNEK